MKRAKSYLKKTSSLHEEKPQTSHLKAMLQYAAVPFTLATALLYLFGHVYYESYLSYWGLPESLFSLSKEQSVIAGFFRYLVYSMSLGPNLRLISLGIPLFLFAVLVSCYRPVIDYLKENSSRLERKAATALQNNIVITDTHDSVMSIFVIFIRSIAILLALTLILAITCKELIRQAKETAMNEHHRILYGSTNNDSFDSRAILYVKKSSNAFDCYSGYLLKTSATHCALYRKETGVSIFPLAGVERLVIRENRKRQ